MTRTRKTGAITAITGLVAAGGPWDWPVVPVAAVGEVDLSVAQRGDRGGGQPHGTSPSPR